MMVPGEDHDFDVPLMVRIPVRPPGLEVAVYPVTPDPLVDVGAMYGTDAVVPSIVTVPTLGAVGAPGA